MKPDDEHLTSLLDALVESLPPVKPSASGRDNLLAALDPATPTAGFERRLARFFDLSETALRSLVAALCDETQWQTFLDLDGIELFRIEGGPRVRGAQTGFIRVRAGMSVPLHRHHGDEYMFVLHGVLVDDDGKVAQPGDIWHGSVGSQHRFDVGPDDLCLCAMLVYGDENAIEVVV